MIIEIPQQLKNKEFRFILIGEKSKIPLEKEWQTKNNYKFDDEKLLNHLKNNGNYGILCGCGSLLIIDTDSFEAQKFVENNLPKTLTIKTGSQEQYKKHYYFYSNKLDTYRLKTFEKDENGNCKRDERDCFIQKVWADVQGKETQIIAPGSIHPSGGIYKIEQDNLINFLSQTQLEEFVEKFSEKGIKRIKETKKIEEKEFPEYNIEKQLKIEDIFDLTTLKKSGDDYYGAHPIHGSSGGMNFWVNAKENTWCCFRCGNDHQKASGGGIASAIAMKEGLIDCSEAVGALTKDIYKIVIKVAKERYGYKPPTKEQLFNEETELIKKIAEKIKLINVDDPNEKRKQTSFIIDNIKNMDVFIVEDLLNLIKEKTGYPIGILRDKIQSERNKKDFANNVSKFIATFTSKRDLAEQFYNLQPIYYDEQKNFWLWDNKEFMWKLSDKTDLLIAISNSSYADTIDTQEKTEIIEALTQIGRERKPKKPETTWIQFKDKIVDIVTEKEFNATPDYFFTNPIPWKLGASDETPNIDKLFREWIVSDQEKDKWVQTLYEICAFCLIPSYPLDVCIALLGTGSNGKTTFEELITKLVGGNNTTTADLNHLVTNRFEAWNLYKKLVCLMGEIDFGILKDSKQFKKVTGRDMISFERKGHDPIKDYNYAKLVIATNALPESFDKSDGFYRRWLLIDFPHQFKQITGFLEKSVPDVEYENLCRKSIKILKDLLRKGVFENQGDIAQRQERYEKRANPFGIFLHECCKLDVNDSVPFWKLYQHFSDFLISRNLRPQSKIEFGRSLKKNNFEMTTPIPTGTTNQEGKNISWQFVKGLCLKDDVLDDKELENKNKKFTIEYSGGIKF